MLKEITIINFKSYLYQKIQLDSSKIHIVIGRNGQGKSNFYSALEFLFKKTPDVISEEVKRSLLHETLENDIISVEALINNSTSRFSVNIIFYSIYLKGQIIRIFTTKECK
jgi:structural maintenance of chromosome 3 (chondroitin sulfate proteoglycan 6)